MALHVGSMPHFAEMKTFQDVQTDNLLAGERNRTTWEIHNWIGHYFSKLKENFKNKHIDTI